VDVVIIGGGINGIMTAWELLKQGHSVTLFEKGEVMQQTSSASSKLLSDGLRYLENLEFRLVKEALKERQCWIEQAPHLAKPLKLFIPNYQNNRRPAWVYKLGLWLDGLLAGKQNIRIDSMSRFSKLSHVLWHCQYHVVWVPNYRYRVLSGKVGFEVMKTILGCKLGNI